MLYRDYLRNFRINTGQQPVKLLLKDFQDDAVDAARPDSCVAQAEARERRACRPWLLPRRRARARRSCHGAIEAASPGRRGCGAAPDATFLWITDQPELNEQTRRKMLDDLLASRTDDRLW